MARDPTTRTPMAQMKPRHELRVDVGAHGHLAATWYPTVHADAGVGRPVLVCIPGGTYTRLVKTTGVNVQWEEPSGEKIWQWAVYTKHGKQWKLHVVPGHEHSLVVRDDPSFGPISGVIVAAVDRTGNESKRVTAKLPKEPKKSE